MRFHLVRHFTIASLTLVALVAVSLNYFEIQRGKFFKELKEEQAAFFNVVQESFAIQQQDAARRDLLAIHEAGNVNLTRLFANALWVSDFAPFVALAQAIDVEVCRAIPDVTGNGALRGVSSEKNECFSEVGRQITAIPGFAELDAKVYDAMSKSTVFKIKVFDLRGVTIYSSEHVQIGEDKSANAGWRGAAIDGVPMSELTHRDTFSAFEGVVEDRDLISSYLPVFEPGSSNIVGVFEVYSDVTPFLKRIDESSAQIRAASADNQRRVDEAAQANQVLLDAASIRQLTTVAALLAMLFFALLLIVRRAGNIILVQERERVSAHQQIAQSEKMASLGQMVAGVAHQLNTPLAFSQNNVAMVRESLQNVQYPIQVAGRIAEVLKKADADPVTLRVSGGRANLDKLVDSDTDISTMREMLSDVLEGMEQMTELVVNLRDFTRLDRAKTTNANLNKALHTVAYIAKTVIPKEVELIEELGALPEVTCNVSQLNQVFLNLINNAAQAIEGPGRIVLRSEAVGDEVRIHVQDTGSGIAEAVLPHLFEPYYTTKPAGVGTGLGLSIARDIVRQHGGDIRVQTEVGVGTTFTIVLPPGEHHTLSAED